MEKLESGNAVLQTIHASEGGRAFKLLQQRQRRQQELETAKTQIESESKKRKFLGIDTKYKGSTTEELEEAFKKETVGLFSAEEFRERRKRLNELIEEREKKETLIVGKPSLTVGKSKQRLILSFLSDEEEEESNHDVTDKSDNGIEVASSECDGTAVSTVVLPRKHFGKDPTVNTDYLKDPDRDAQRALERELLAREFYMKEEKIQAEPLDVTYSYWDGSGHRRVARITKGTTIGDFLKICHETLEREFSELRGVTTENLMYIKEDLILPHDITFYQLIKTKARGKSGPLFHFDVHEDVRMYSDARIEKDESHAGKIVDRKWYERNKHIFPASRWQIYDQQKTFEKYTIHGNYDYS